MAPYTPQSSLLSPGRIGQARWAEALAKRIPRAEADLIAAIYHTESRYSGHNPDLALAQACEETGWFTSDRWRRQHNPCGLGITSDAVRGADFLTPQRGIRAHFEHLCCYTHTADDCPVDRTIMVDPRHGFHDGNPALSHLQDDTRKWATKPGYVGRILAIANALLPQETPSMAPKPPITTKPSPNRGYNNGYKHEPQAIVWHITEGTNSLPWLTNPASQASSNYLVARDGTIYELVPPTESAWANGAVCKPDTTNPLIASWRATPALNWNQRTISIEHEGFTSKGKGGSLAAPQVAATVALTAWLCEQFGIAPDQSHILGHYEIDNCARSNCPGFSVGEWQSWVVAVATLVNAGPPPPTASGVVTPARDWDGQGEIIHTFSGVIVRNDEGRVYLNSERDGTVHGWIELTK